MKDLTLLKGKSYMEKMHNKERIKMMELAHEFELKKKMIFDWTSELASLIDRRNDFYEHAGTVAEVIRSTKLAEEKNFAI